MKIEKEKPVVTFAPITITIETEKEAEFLWHRLNCSFLTVFDEYCKKEKYSASPSMNDDLWHDLNKVYPLREHKDC